MHNIHCLFTIRYEMRVRYLPPSFRDLLAQDRITFYYFYDQVNPWSVCYTHAAITSSLGTARIKTYSDTQNLTICFLGDSTFKYIVVSEKVIWVHDHKMYIYNHTIYRLDSCLQSLAKQFSINNTKITVLCEICISLGNQLLHWGLCVIM